MRWIRCRCILALAAALGLAACAPAAPPAARGPEAVGSGQPAERRTLVVAIRVEPVSIATRPLRQAGVGLYMPRRMFNAEIAQLDDRGNGRPYLVEALPQLNTDSWRVFPDGRMETTYRLKPGITWHDGAPLTTGDFLFSWRVSTTPALGQSTLSPFRAMEDVVALDDRTFAIRWKQIYPDVAFLVGLNVEFPPLPRHILEPTLETDIEAFANHPWWTREFVGLGPYRLDRWELGAFLEGTSNPAHLGGPPKIERIKLIFISDARTALANILAGEVHLTDGTAVGLPEVGLLKTEWVPSGRGSVLLHPNQWRAAHFQHRADLTTPRALLNPTVRKALAHAVNKAPLNDAIYYGEGILTDSPFAPTSVWGQAAERGTAKYPYDLRRAEQLMNEAGFSRGPDGFFASPQGRFTFEVKTNQGSDNESEVTILASEWRQAGFDAREAVLAAAQAQNAELRATFESMFTNSQNCCESALLGLSSSAIPTAQNRWAGGNRSGWSNPEFDRLLDAFTNTPDRSERERQLSELLRTLTDDVQSISLFIRSQPWTHVNELRGLRVVPPEANMAWNITEWELQ